ncbi:glycosyltransferase [Mycobacterium yunnanensis]|uniref:Glycosyltransferase n=1 Tax=Mycobacterium yunnanensis TaxID=368477 RepID=A0A9X2Z3H0_9MYCO|nr:glycosyltransferase [Mycobacterium yunnanensis]MCV7421262.1 glycosyltransferase [Mycobacterium yunnanensis]
MSSSLTSRRVLVWHVHGSWMDSFTAGRHDYLIPVDDDARAGGLRGRDWPHAVEVPSSQLADEDVDVVVLQAPEQLALAEAWLGRRIGPDVPAIYVEHNAPRPSPVDSVHPMAGRRDVVVVHVTQFNRLMWDNGMAPVSVVAHGIHDPGPLYTGEILSAATMINEPVRRWRTVGADLLEDFGRHVPVDVWGIGTDGVDLGAGVTGRGDVATRPLMAEVARRRLYVHTARWTSLGLSLLEAMFLGMPVVAVASTMAPLVVPAGGGVVDADVEVLGWAAETYVADHGAAVLAGKIAREYATSHFGIGRFLAEWDLLIEEACS